VGAMSSKPLSYIGLLALSLVAALAVACGDATQSDDAGGPQSLGGEDATAAAPPRNNINVDALDGGGSVLSPEEDAAPDAAPQAFLDRQVVRTATVELEVEDIAGTMQLIETAAIGAGGFVSGSNLTVESGSEDDDDPRRLGTITIRVPSERYISVMNEVRRLVDDPAAIKSLQENASEVTEEYTDLQSRLRNLEATEAQYLALLAQAVTIDEILLVQDRLNGTRAEIEQVTGRIQVLDDLTSLATITVQLALPPVAPAAAGSQQHWASETLENAWQASEETLRVLGIIAITAGVFLAWMVVPGAIGLGAWWFVTSRRQTDKLTN
jgi:hypothetical protein